MRKVSNGDDIRCLAPKYKKGDDKAIIDELLIANKNFRFINARYVDE